MRVFRKLYIITLQILRFKIAYSLYGVRLKANWLDATFKMYVGAYYGHYYSDFLKKYPHSFSFLDIGANQGLYSIIAGKNVHCNKVICFEPVPKTAEVLDFNLKLNKISSSKIIQKAISNSSGTKSIYTSNTHTGGASLKNVNNFATDQTTEIFTIDAVEIDKLVDLSSEKRIVVKIDVEGHEKQVLEQLKHTQFAQKITDIFIKVDENWCSYQEISELLRQMQLTEITKIGNGSHYDVHAKVYKSSS